MSTFHVMTNATGNIERPAVRQIAVSDVFASLREGYEDFREKPSHYAFVALIYPIAGAMMIGWSAGVELLPRGRQLDAVPQAHGHAPRPELIVRQIHPSGVQIGADPVAIAVARRGRPSGQTAAARALDGRHAAGQQQLAARPVVRDPGLRLRRPGRSQQSRGPDQKFEHSHPRELTVTLTDHA